MSALATKFQFYRTRRQLANELRNEGRNRKLLCFVPDAPWAILLASIEPEATAVTVNGLIPARSYQFRLCAVNDVGKGQFSKETER